VGRETLRIRRKNLTDIVQNKSQDVSPKDIVSKHMTESVQNLIVNLRSRGCNESNDGLILKRSNL